MDAQQVPLATFFREQANWRLTKAEEYPEDDRNRQSADALEALADFVESEASPQVIADIEVWWADPQWEGTLEPGPESRREVSRYGYGYKTVARHHDEFLAELRTLAYREAYELARETKDKPLGDALRDFEVDAAIEGVVLPAAYFERVLTDGEREDWILECRTEVG